MGKLGDFFKGLGLAAIGTAGFLFAPLLGAATFKTVFGTFGGLLKAFGKAFAVSAGLFGANYAVNLWLAPDRERNAPRQDLRTTITTTSTDARYIIGESQVNGLLTALSQAQVSPAAAIPAPALRFFPTIASIDAYLARRGSSAGTSHQTISASTAYQRLLAGDVGNPLQLIYTLANHPCESLVGISINGKYLPFEDELQGRGSSSFQIDLLTPEQKASANPRIDEDTLGMVEIDYNLTGDGNAFPQDAGLNVLISYQERFYTIEDFSTSTNTRRLHLARVCIEFFSVQTGGRFTFICTNWFSASSGSSATLPDADKVLNLFERTTNGERIQTVGFPENNHGFGLSYAILRFPIDDEDQRDYWRTVGGVPNQIEWRIKGIKDIDIPERQETAPDGTTSILPATKGWSDNPVGALKWIYTNLATFRDDEIEPMSYAVAYSKARDLNYNVNGFLTTSDIESATEEIQIAMRGGVGFDGLLRFFVGERTNDRGITVNKEDIIDIPSVTLFEDNFSNSAIGEFRDANENYQVSSTGEIIPEWRRPNALRHTLNAETFAFHNNLDYAQRSTRFLLNVHRFAKTFTMRIKATPKFENIRQHDLITMDFEEKPELHNKRFIINSYELTPEMTYDLNLTEYVVDLFDGVLDESN